MTPEGQQFRAEMEESKICAFYRDKHVLLTGATGFLGKLILEKLLRVCKVKMVYLVIRSKKTSEPLKRLQDLMQSIMFDRLKKEVPDYIDRISLVCGDISMPGLDLMPYDRDILIDKVQIVIHGAATVKFDEKLDMSTKINVKGTIAILELCRQMKNLQSVIHVSTAYSNCLLKTIKEEFYESPISSDNLIKLTECLKEKQLDMIAPHIMDKWPNTYVFTKAVAEEAVRIHGKGLPVAIFRPAMVIGTKSEPVPGWSDNLYGPQGISVGTGIGVIHVVRCDANAKTDIVPADFTVSCLLAVGYKTSTLKSHNDIQIYNFCTDPKNTITWGDYMKICQNRALQVPPSKGIWYCSCSLIKNWFPFFLLTLLLHTIPALIVDTGLLIMNKKTRALSIYKKIHKLQHLISFFSTKSWNFSVDNTVDLWKSLSSADKKLFPFEMAEFDFQSYLYTYVDGIRLYIIKEDPSTVPYAKKRTFILYTIHRLVQIVFFANCGWILWRSLLLMMDLIN